MPVPLGWCNSSSSTVASKEYTVNFSQTTSGGRSLVQTISQVASQNTAGNAPFYQWGRKDPFVGSTGLGETTKTWYDGSGNIKTDNDPATIPEPSKAESIQYPEKFGTGYHVWDSGITTYDNWNANVTSIPTSDNEAFNDNVVEKTVYDPSPVGFKMPTTNAFTGFASELTANCEGSWDSGYKFITGLTSPNPISIYFRANGSRTDGGWLLFVTTRGFYWASGLKTETMGCALNFWEEGYVGSKVHGYRVEGFSVIPVSE